MSVIIDKCADAEVFSFLKKLNINYYKSCSLDFLYTPVNTHPDMQIHFINDKTAVVAPSAFLYYRSVLPDCITLYKGYRDPGSTYPEDCAYNVANLGKKVIGNLIYTDNKIKEIYSQMGYDFISVKQGYTKCNLCIVDKNSVITEDEGLSKTLSENGINVLKLSYTEVELKGFKNGFIGGASGLISDNTLILLGNLDLHSEKNIIKSYLSKRGVDIICLLSTKLKDFGSILYVNDDI